MLYLDWLTGLVTLIGVWLTGKKRWQGQAIQFISQILWAALIVQRGLWGLVPLEVALFYLYARNTRIWYKEEANARKASVPSV